MAQDCHLFIWYSSDVQQKCICHCFFWWNETNWRPLSLLYYWYDVKLLEATEVVSYRLKNKENNVSFSQSRKSRSKEPRSKVRLTSLCKVVWEWVSQLVSTSYRDLYSQHSNKRVVWNKCAQLDSLVQNPMLQIIIYCCSCCWSNDILLAIDNYFDIRGLSLIKEYLVLEYQDFCIFTN